MNNRLIITPVKDADGKFPIGVPFVAMINPSSIAISYKVNYADDKAGGSTTSEPKFSSNNSPELSFDLILDGTGAFSEITGSPLAVEAQLELFKQACYYYVGDIHQLPFVLITWWAPLFRYKEQCFAGTIDSFSVTYTLFSPLGLPLRAKISAKFLGAMNKITELNLKGDKSPDLTHSKIINEGTSLSALCKEVYGDESYILEVARLNNLVSFRNIKAGTKLIFPPIK